MFQEAKVFGALMLNALTRQFDARSAMNFTERFLVIQQLPSIFLA